MRDFYGVLVRGPVDPDQGGKPAVEPGLQQDFLETVVDPGDIGYADDAAVRVGLDDDLLELRAPVGLALGADENVASLGADVTGGDIQRTALHGLGDIRQGQVELAQPVLGCFYADFILPDRVQPDLRHPADA